MRTLSRQSLAALVDMAPDAILCADTHGLIVLVNAATLEIFGYGREELLGQPVEVLVPDARRQTHAAHRAAYFVDPKPRPMGLGLQLSGRRRDGSEFPAEISLAAIHAEQGTLVTAVIRDLTDRLAERAERDRLRRDTERHKALLRTQQAERLEALGQLAGGVAHDFNNLLAVILNYVAFVSEELASATAQNWPVHCEAARTDLEQVRQAGERAADLTRQLLAFARREVVRPRVLDINTVVTGLETMLRRTLGEHIRLTATLAPGLWPVLADPGQMEQILVNLAVNARDAMPEGGTLAIDTGNVTVDEESIAGGAKAQAGKHVRLRVSDTGSGMTREVQDHAFDPFYTTRGTNGTGLGLATVHGIVTQAGGTIQLYSEAGSGTTFIIMLPVTTEAARSEPALRAYQRASTGETVLLVEDESALREVTRRIFARHGYRVLVAANGREALDIAREHAGDIHLLATDVIMPGMPGKEVAEEMARIRPGIKVLFMSAYARQVLADQGQLHPHVALVEKPFSEADLMSTAGLVLDGFFETGTTPGGDSPTPLSPQP